MKVQEKIKMARELMKQRHCIPELKERLKEVFKEGYYNILLYQHLGDDFFRVSLKKDLEELYGPCHFIIKPNEEILIKMWGVENYTVFDVDKIVHSCLKDIHAHDSSVYAYYEAMCIENTITSKPNTQEVFIIFNDSPFYLRSKYVESFGYPKTITNRLNANLNIMRDTKIDVREIAYPEMTKSFLEKIQKVGDLDRIVLLAPEARSDELFDKKIWEQLAKDIEKSGYIIIENIVNSENHIKGALNLNLSVEELVMLAMNCHSVFSIRSGLCDLIAAKNKNLYVLWHIERYEEESERFGLENIFDFSETNKPYEIVLSNRYKPTICWEGRNLSKNIKKEWLPQKTVEKSYKNILQNIFSFTNEKNHKVITFLGIKFKLKYYAKFKQWKKTTRIQKRYGTLVEQLRDKTKTKKVNIVFLVYQNSRWKCQSLYDELINDENFNVKILLTIADFQIFYAREEKIAALQKNYDFFKERKMNVEYAWDLATNCPIDLVQWSPDIIFYQSPYVHDPVHHVENMSNTALCCYVPYYINQSEDFNLMGANHWHKCLYRWYVLDDYWKRISQQKIGIQKNVDTIKAVGHPQLDYYYLNQEKSQKHTDSYVIYASHWSVGRKDGLSSFLDTGPFMLEYAKKHPEINWCFTHHPSLTYNIVAKGFMTKDEIQNYYDEWRKIAYFYEQGDYMELFQNSELLISDCGSFRVEYFLTGKPYIYLISNSPERLQDGLFLNEICKNYYKTHNIVELQKTLDMLLVEKIDPLKEQRNKLVMESNFANTYAAKNIITDLYDILKLKKPHIIPAQQ